MRIHPTTLLGISAIMIAHLSTARGATPVLRVGFDSWVGFAGVFAAVDQGFFEKEGVRVELRSFPGPTDTIPPTIAGDLDIALTTPDNVMSVDAGQKADLVTIDVIDVSVGADAVVARNDIVDVAGLKNKKIAVTFGQCNELLLLEALARSGLKQSDVTLVNMDADAAGAAFIAGRLDGAVTWEPWLTQVTSSGKGHLLFSSKLAPNIIFDSAAVTRRFAAGHKKEIEAFIRGMDAGVAYLRSHPEETYAIVAKALAIKPADVALMLKGVKVFDLDDNRELFGDPVKPGQIYAAMDSVADFQVAQQLYKVKPVIGTTLDSTFVRAASMNKPVRPPAPAGWFHVFPIDERTYALSEPKYWQENVSYLLIGTQRALLFDTGPGIYSIRAAVQALTSLPVIVIPSHLHFDHVGDLEEFADVRLLDTPRLRAQVRGGYFVETPDEYQVRGSIK
jgi:NitT/TauT family transport system substrate-binding protein